MPDTLKAGLPAAVAALNQRTIALDHDIAGLRQSLDTTASRFEAAIQSLNAKLDARASAGLPNLISIFAVVAAVAIALWGAGIEPVAKRVEYVNADALLRDTEQSKGIDKINDELLRRNELFVSVARFKEYQDRVKSEHDGIQKQIEAVRH